MGTYLVPELLKKGYCVDVISLDSVQSDNPQLRYFRGDAADDEYLCGILQNRYDGIIDFMIYGTQRFRERHSLLLENTGHYIYLSSYRVYADSMPLTESSPRLLDIMEDINYLTTDDYALLKARGEDILKNSRYHNWTIVRPSCVYSKRRYQMCTLEANVFLLRARQRKPVVLPEEAKEVQAAMTWSGDIAKMFSGVLFNERSLEESYTFATAEHNSWGTVASYYKELLDMEAIWVPQNVYLSIVSGSSLPNTGAYWQLKLDRLYNRVIDNRKILKHAGLRQEDFTLLRDGLKREIAELPEDVNWPDDNGVNKRMDAYLKTIKRA